MNEPNRTSNRRYKSIQYDFKILELVLIYLAIKQEENKHIIVNLICYEYPYKLKKNKHNS